MKKILLTAGLASAVLFGVQAQETPTEPTQEKEMQTQEQTMQEKPESAQQANSNEFDSKSEDMKQITEAELPQEVKDSFANSDLNEGTIEQAFEISGATVARVLESRANASQYPGTELPEKLYQLQVKEEDGTGIIYIGDDGEIISSESM